MDSVRKIYQDIVPFSVRDKIAKKRNLIHNRIFGEDYCKYKLPRMHRVLSAYKRSKNTNICPFPSEIEILLERLSELPSMWHQAGTLHIKVLKAMTQHILNMPMPLVNSMETGCGKSTLLLSHMSAHHTVFTLGKDDDSLERVLKSPLLNPQNIEIEAGPTQRTLPSYQFKAKVQFALIDGPHAYPFPDLEYYYIYPHLDTNAILVIDDIHIPNVFNMFDVIAADEMFELLQIVKTTAFFRRTDQPTFDPLTGSFMDQKYNEKLTQFYNRLGLRY